MAPRRLPAIAAALFSVAAFACPARGADRPMNGSGPAAFVSWRIRDVLDPQTGSLRAALLEDARRFPIPAHSGKANEPNAGAARQTERGG